MLSNAKLAVLALVGAYHHPTAIIDEGAEVGVFTSIWHYSHLMGAWMRT